MRKYLEKRYKEDNNLIAYVMVDESIYDEFIEWESVRNPTIKYVEADLSDKNKYYVHNYHNEFREEWTKNNKGKFKFKGYRGIKNC